MNEHQESFPVLSINREDIARTMGCDLGDNLTNEQMSLLAGKFADALSVLKPWSILTDVVESHLAQPGVTKYLYLISQDRNHDHGAYKSAVVVAGSESEAQLMHPNNAEIYEPGIGWLDWQRRHEWCSPYRVRVRRIGKARPGECGVICAQHNAKQVLGKDLVHSKHYHKLKEKSE